jgi:acetoin utilization deacetylase AcuC-like enzyme
VQAADQHCQGRIVSLLEGGYNVDAQAESVEIHLDVLVPAKP